jgi:hypothetical protein
MENKMQFNTGDIIRYNEGVSALFKYTGTKNNNRYYGEHVLGGYHSAEDLIFTKLKLADEKDLEFCRKHKPEWF